MYVILVYDINVKRVTRTLKVCRQYLTWVQNSVFEGELTEGKLTELKLRLKKVIKEDEDSILIYRLRDQKLFRKEIMGQERNPVDTFL